MEKAAKMKEKSRSKSKAGGKARTEVAVEQHAALVAVPTPAGCTLAEGDALVEDLGCSLLLLRVPPWVCTTSGAC